MKVRKLVETDLSQVNDIFNWHSENGISTFSDATSLDERKEWFQRFDSPEHIALVAEDKNQVLGVACSFAYRDGGVFKNTVETSIYLHHKWMGKGLGGKMYSKLLEDLERTGVHRIVVGIALPNEGSISIHKKFGFEEIGKFDEYAYYKGRYRSSIWMQKLMK